MHLHSLDHITHGCTDGKMQKGKKKTELKGRNS